jgi:hypothetical protein
MGAVPSARAYIRAQSSARYSHLGTAPSRLKLDRLSIEQVGPCNCNSNRLVGPYPAHTLVLLKNRQDSYVACNPGTRGLHHEISVWFTVEGCLGKGRDLMEGKSIKCFILNPFFSRFRTKRSCFGKYTLPMNLDILLGLVHDIPAY